MVRKLLMALAIVGVSVSASACKTVKGLGNDIESVGEAGGDALD